MSKNNKSTRMSAFLFTWSIGAFAVCLAPASTWQDDPFATEDTDVQDTAEIPVDPDPFETDEPLDEGADLVVRSIRDSNPSTPIDLARATRTMLDIKQYREAKRYLELLMNSGATDQQYYELLQRMGPDFLLELRDQKELQPGGSAFALSVFETANRAAFSPDRIRQLIANLSSDDRFSRTDAVRRLKELGAPAAAEMLNACVDENRKKELPYIQSALKQMGKPALLPMIGAVRADGTVVQAIAIGTLSNINTPLATDALYRPSISNKVPVSARAIAAEAVARQGLVGSHDIEQRIFDRANAYLEGSVKLDSDSKGETVIWNWNFEKNQLVPTRTQAVDAVQFLAVDLARDVYQLNPSNLDYRHLQLMTVLDATKRVLGPNRFVLNSEVSRYVNQPTSQEVDRALSDAIDRMLFPAAIGAAELLGQTGDESSVFTHDSKPSNLVRAILTGHRHLQFAAAKSIVEIDPKNAFPGCSYVARFMTYMAGSHGAGAGLAAHPDLDVAQRLASSIFQAGLVGQSANTPQQLFDELNSNADLEIIMVTDSFSHPHYQEIVQQIRRNWMTKLTPIALLVRNDHRLRQAEMVLDGIPHLLVVPSSSNPQLVYGQIQRLTKLQQPWPVSNVQRYVYSDYAISWISKALADPETYRFYHLNCFRDDLANLMHTRNSWQAKSEVLSDLGTATAQRELVNIASVSSLNLDKRQVVARAFAKSVDQAGILLTTSEIQQQYDRYNASRSESEESRNIFASILNAIESRSQNSP